MRALLPAGSADRLKEELKDGPEGGGLPGRLFIPSTMLRAGETVFLDDLTCRDVERELGVRVIAVENDGRALLKKILTR